MTLLFKINRVTTDLTLCVNKNETPSSCLSHVWRHMKKVLYKGRICSRQKNIASFLNRYPSTVLYHKHNVKYELFHLISWWKHFQQTYSFHRIPGDCISSENFLPTKLDKKACILRCESNIWKRSLRGVLIKVLRKYVKDTLNIMLYIYIYIYIHIYIYIYIFDII